MRSSYKPEEVTILLKDITGLVTPLETQERERRIQSGVHYSEMLPVEYEPTPAYLQTYESALALYADQTAEATARLGDWIWREKGRNAVLVSLARAGTSIGVLVRRWIQRRYGAEIPHYTISIIRGRGIDRCAMDYILARHTPESLQFVDGWTGKGAIQRQLSQAMADYPAVDPGVGVLSDPAQLAAKYGTRDDFLIASSCLNATISGLMSRTFFRQDIIGPTDFHGALFYENLRGKDQTASFLDTIEAHFPAGSPPPVEEAASGLSGLEEAEAIGRAFGIADINLVKPSIGEATRVLLRRVPWKILVRSLDDHAHLGHLYQLARERGVAVEEYPLVNYRACGLIQPMGGADV